jgi:hypothetical protein
MDTENRGDNAGDAAHVVGRLASDVEPGEVMPVDSVLMKCSQCDEDLFISTRTLIELSGRTIVYYCVKCVMVAMQKAIDNGEEVTVGTTQEVREMIERGTFRN